MAISSASSTGSTCSGSTVRTRFRLVQFLSIAVLSLSILSGCGGAKPDNGTPASIGALKQNLTLAAQSGEGGSALMGLQSSFNEIEATHPELHAKLSPKFQKLWNSSKPEEIKKLTGEMLTEIDAVIK